MKNTINFCIGHLPFPEEYASFIDLMISPHPIECSQPCAIVPDEIYGPHGNSLSEYAQLIWLNKHLTNLAGENQYLRIFHYRRFVSHSKPTTGEKSTNLPWATAVREENLNIFAHDFDRFSDIEVYNTPTTFKNGMLGQYASNHEISDILNFTLFLLDEGIFTPDNASEFLNQTTLIPSANIGVFQKETFRLIFNILTAAAEFANSQYFTARNGYQRRSVGFLLERLNSYLILKVLESDPNRGIFGHNIVISPNLVVSHTT